MKFFFIIIRVILASLLFTSDLLDQSKCFLSPYIMAMKPQSQVKFNQSMAKTVKVVVNFGTGIK
jgi:hypothetical protein